MRRILGMTMLAASVAAAGCLQKETTHTLYLSPDGRLSWMVVETSVRSDENEPARRIAEEQTYLSEALNSAHAVGRGLASLDATWLRTRIIRDERPFVVVTEAEFSSLEFAVRRLLAQAEIDAQIVAGDNGGVKSLVVRIDAVAEEQKTHSEHETPITALIEDVDRYTFVLTEGRFVSAKGFTLLDGGTRAVPIETPWEKIVENGGIVELSLAWTR